MRDAFSQIIDYAGLFPPASSSMHGAVDNFAEYRLGNDRDLLNRFVVAATRLEEFGSAALALAPRLRAAAPFPLSVVMGMDTDAEVALVHKYLSHAPVATVIEAAEMRVGAVGEVRAFAEQLPPHWETFLEVPHAEPFDRLVGELAAFGFSAKIRTGGTQPDRFPPAGLVASFLSAVVRRRVPFKATAGLHHALSGTYPLTYRIDSPIHLMFGYLNLVTATAMILEGEREERVEAVLSDTNRKSFTRRADRLIWRDFPMDHDLLLEVRKLFRGFGSCSFAEPVRELELPWRS